MLRSDIDEITLLKKGETAKLLGFGGTAGYRYLDHLALLGVLKPIFLPAIKTPRYRREEVQAVIDSAKEEPDALPQFKAYR